MINFSDMNSGWQEKLVFEYVEMKNLTEFYDDNRFADFSFLFEFLANF